MRDIQDNERVGFLRDMRQKMNFTVDCARVLIDGGQLQRDRTTVVVG